MRFTTRRVGFGSLAIFLVSGLPLAVPFADASYLVIILASGHLAVFEICKRRNR